jgi:hypothetical protein
LLISSFGIPWWPRDSGLSNPTIFSPVVAERVVIIKVECPSVKYLINTVLTLDLLGKASDLAETEGVN